MACSYISNITSFNFSHLLKIHVGEKEVVQTSDGTKSFDLQRWDRRCTIAMRQRLDTDPRRLLLVDILKVDISTIRDRFMCVSSTSDVGDS